MTQAFKLDGQGSTDVRQTARLGKRHHFAAGDQNVHWLPTLSCKMYNVMFASNLAFLPLLGPRMAYNFQPRVWDSRDNKRILVQRKSSASRTSHILSVDFRDQEPFVKGQSSFVSKICPVASQLPNSKEGLWGLTSMFSGLQRFYTNSNGTTCDSGLTRPKGLPYPLDTSRTPTSFQDEI